MATTQDPTTTTTAPELRESVTGQQIAHHCASHDPLSHFGCMDARCECACHDQDGDGEMTGWGNRFGRV